MKKLIFIGVFALCCFSVVAKSPQSEFSTLEKSLNILQEKQTECDKRLQQQSTVLSENRSDILMLQRQKDTLKWKVDSIKKICEDIEKAQTEDRASLNGKIQNANNVIASNQSVVERRSMFGIIIAVVIILALSIVTYWFVKRLKRGTSSIDEVRKAQNALQEAQAKMQEESIKLDNKLIELLEKQMPSPQIERTDAKEDHSLAMKVADEIVRIELNLSRMDTSIKGYKQLAKAVQRIKDNFQANGYEIVDMLGKNYVQGMKAAVTFVTDETLEPGQQIITKIIKPQINYKQQMIQAAQIEVSQSE